MCIYEDLVFWSQHEEWHTSPGPWQVPACLFKVRFAGWAGLLFVSLYVPSLYSSVFTSNRAVLLFTLCFTVLSCMPQPPIFPCTIGIPTFVLLNTLSSFVYRNVRFGYFRDYSITSSVITDAAVQRSDHSAHHHELVFENSTPAKLEERGLDAGDSNNGEVTSSRNSKGEVWRLRKTTVVS